VGRRLPGVQGSAAAATLSALCFLPVAVVTFVHHPPTPAALWAAVAVGLLSSVVPQVADLVVLRRLPAAVFAILMSAHPVFAALVGIVGLGEHLGAGQWAGMGVIIGANVWSVLAAGCRIPPGGAGESALSGKAGEPALSGRAGEPALSVSRSTMAG
jgi:inner membrane transporter RhtA